VALSDWAFLTWHALPFSLWRARDRYGFPRFSFVPLTNWFDLGRWINLSSLCGGDANRVATRVWHLADASPF